MRGIGLLQTIATSLDRLDRLTKQVDQIATELDAFKESVAQQLRMQDGAHAQLRERVARLEESRETIKETVRAEITASVAELRVRYAEEQSRPQRKLPKRTTD